MCHKGLKKASAKMFFGMTLLNTFALVIVVHRVVRVEEGLVPDNVALKNKGMFRLFFISERSGVEISLERMRWGLFLREVSLAPSRSRTGMMCSQKYIVYWLLSSHRRRVLQCTN